MDAFRVSILFFLMVPWLLVLAIPVSRSNPRRLLLTSSNGEWQEEQLRRLSEESTGEHGRKSERRKLIVVPKGALYNMYYLAHPHILALFEPVNKTYDYFTFASCFTKTSSRGQVKLLSDDPDLEDLLFIDDPAATTPPSLNYQLLHPMGDNIEIDDIAAAVESSSGKILGPYDALSHNCAYRLVELGHKLGKMPSSGQHQIAERDALIQYFAKGLESFGLADRYSQKQSGSLEDAVQFGRRR